jgi:outer membrane protein assembly factor BamA
VTNFFVARSHDAVSETEGGARPFVTDKTDVTAEQRIRPIRRLELTYSYTFERNHTFEQGVDLNDPLAFNLSVNIARLGSTVRFDSRNDLLDASRGMFHSSSLEYAPEKLGSDLRFLKYLLLQNYYRPLTGRLVVASAFRLGLATGFGEGLIPSERFFAGGGNSVRGYRQDALGPRDFFGQPSGGNALLVFNEELRFPIVWRFRGVGFFDAGRAFERPADLSLGALGTSVGFGLRVDTPVALLRVDFGVPIKPPSGEPRRTIFFSIGQAF